MNWRDTVFSLFSVLLGESASHSRSWLLEDSWERAGFLRRFEKLRGHWRIRRNWQSSSRLCMWQEMTDSSPQAALLVYALPKMTVPDYQAIPRSQHEPYCVLAKRCSYLEGRNKFQNEKVLGLLDCRRKPCKVWVHPQSDDELNFDLI